MTKKKKTRRSQKKYPNLIPEYNLKLRRDYIDNHHYVNGVKDIKGSVVMDPLVDDAKEYLNQFNKEYYNASFDKVRDNRLHKQLVDDDTILSIKQQIKSLKKKRSYIFNKKAENTTDNDRDEVYMLNEQIEDIFTFLRIVHPKKTCEDLNNTRNRCFVNRNKASNEITLVSWESVNPESVTTIDSELYFQYISKQEEGDDV